MRQISVLTSVVPDLKHMFSRTHVCICVCVCVCFYTLRMNLIQNIRSDYSAKILIPEMSLIFWTETILATWVHSCLCIEQTPVLQWKEAEASMLTHFFSLSFSPLCASLGELRWTRSFYRGARYLHAAAMVRLRHGGHKKCFFIHMEAARHHAPQRHEAVCAGTCKCIVLRNYVVYTSPLRSLLLSSFLVDRARHAWDSQAR